MAGRIKLFPDGGYKLKGVWDDDIPKKFLEEVKVREEFDYQKFRIKHKASMARCNLQTGYVNARRLCELQKITVQVCDGNDSEVIVFVLRPTELTTRKERGLIYCHGGGAIAGHGEEFLGRAAHLAVESGTVVFHTDYRLGPEANAEQQAMDVYATLKEIRDNWCEKFGVSRTRLALYGESGGCNPILACATLLSNKGETDLVRTIILSRAMLLDYFFTQKTEEMTREEANSCDIMRKITELLGRDIKEQLKNKDLMLFPGLADHNILRSLPPIIIMEVEFDLFATANRELANRLDKAGKLLEYVVHPGCGHGMQYNLETKGAKRFFKDFRTVVQEYV